MVRSKITVPLPYVFELTSRGINDLHITSDVFLAIECTELIFGLIGDFSDVEFVIADGQQVIIHVLENEIRDCSIRAGGITQAIAIVQIASVNQEEVHAKTSGLALHVAREGHKISPVCAIVLLLEVTFQPSMCIRGVHEIQLAPLQRGSGLSGSHLSFGLHASDISRRSIVLSRSIAIIASRRQSENCSQRDQI